MSSLIKLIIWEFTIQNKINNLSRYLFVFFLFYTVSVVLVNDHEQTKKFGLIFSSLYLPLSLIGLANLVLKQDLEDGTLELLLASFSAEIIIFSKFLGIMLGILASSLISLPVIFIIFDLTMAQLLHFSVAFILLLIIAGSLLLLISAMQTYFRSNANLISLLIMPLLLPGIIITGMLIKAIIIHEETGFLMLIMLGINCILVPANLISASYLTRNIYNS